VQVVEHQHHGLALLGERRAQARETARPQRASRRRERVEDLGPDAAVDVQRLGDVREKDDRIVVAVVERDPGEPAAVRCGPLAERRGLAVAGRCDDAGETSRSRPREALDEAGPRDVARPGGRDVELRPKQFERLRPVGPGP
jgi:hypothetical protein